MADCRHLKKSKNGHCFTTIWLIGTKYGTVTDIDSLNCSFVRSLRAGFQPTLVPGSQR